MVPQGTIGEEDVSLLTLVDDPEQVVDRVLSEAIQQYEYLREKEPLNPILEKLEKILNRMGKV
jgi:hypothetical protein